jgi:hypothetical protein
MFGRKGREMNKILYYDNKVNYFLSPHVGTIPALIPEIVAANQQTTAIYVDFLRTDSYTEVGSRTYPYKTLAAAYASAELTVSDSNPKILVLLSGNIVAENITFVKGHIFLVGENSSGTHAPIVFTGSLTFIGQSASISSNHFAVAGLQLLGVSGISVVAFSGSNPQRLFLKDVWITANGSSHGITMTNTGTGSTLHANDCKFSHNGAGHYHCLNIESGTANIDSSESSGATVGIVGILNGSCNITDSDIQSAGDYAIDVYTAGTLSVANSKITTTKAESHGISLTAATAIAIVGNVSFSVKASATTGRAINGVASSFPYGLYYGPVYFLPDGVGGTTNSKFSTAMAKTAILNTFTNA